MTIPRRGEYCIANSQHDFVCQPDDGNNVVSRTGKGKAWNDGGMGGGIASAGVFAPIYDSEKHPIPAGGFTESGDVILPMPL